MTHDVATDLFLSLTPDTVLEAVEAGGLRCNPVCYALNSFENRVYEIELEDKSRIVAKFYRPGRWTEHQILEEHRFMADLAAAEIDVCNVLAFPDGATLKRAGHIYYCLYPRTGGRAPEEINADEAERLGMFVARMHNVGGANVSEHRVQMSGDTYIRDNLSWMKANTVIPEAYEARYFAAAHSIADIADRWMDGTPKHRIHGDFHLGNLLLRNERFYALDFDDMVVGPAVQDLWLLMPGRDASTKRLHNIFVDAYEQLRAFDRSSLRLIEPLRGMRYIHYATWLARRWHDPAFPRTWPHFGTQNYWAQETADLEEQLSIIERDDPNRSTADEPEPDEISNKDLFWDWEE